MINVFTQDLRAPEEIELEKKRAELEPLEDELSQVELDLATLSAELKEFEAVYIERVGRLYAELDEIEAEIAEEELRLYPDDEEVRLRAEAARLRAQESADATNSVSWQSGNRKFNPPPALKRMYRALARLIHPDLTTDGCEAERRTHVMAQANKAYESGDERVISSLLDEWKHSPEMVKGDDIGAELVRVIRKLSQASKRIAAGKAEFALLKASELCHTRQQADEEERAGRDLLSQMADRATSKIKRARQRLEHLREVETEKPAIRIAS